MCFPEFSVDCADEIRTFLEVAIFFELPRGISDCFPKFGRMIQINFAKSFRDHMTVIRISVFVTVLGEFNETFATGRLV